MDRAGDLFAGLEGRPEGLGEHGRRDLVMGLAHWQDARQTGELE